jgi:hypothetical protein
VWHLEFLSHLAFFQGRALPLYLCGYLSLCLSVPSCVSFSSFPPSLFIVNILFIYNLGDKQAALRM